MKTVKLLVTGLVIFAVLSMGFVSCGGDDDDPTTGTLIVVNKNVGSNYITKIKILTEAGVVLSTHDYEGTSFTTDESDSFELDSGTYGLKITRMGSSGTPLEWSYLSTFTITAGNTTTIKFDIMDEDNWE